MQQINSEQPAPDFSQVKNYCSGDSSIPDFSWIVKNNPSGWIIRPNINEKTGGLLDRRTMANLDSLGKGIPGRITSGRKVAYPVQAVVEFLIKRYKIVNPDEHE